MISATFDTSVYIRALNFGGRAALLLGHAETGRIRIDISDAIISETIGVLREKFRLDGYTIHAAQQRLLALCNRVMPETTLCVIAEDPDDNRVLECAVAAKSNYIVSEDKDLLRLGEYAGARIVTISEFMNIALEHRQVP